ncbi:hypothetical protein COU56_01770 [Candidatus Pacearchaeota archaeon CG10_big_fil_rev_8_21_14_0_10_31_9]|nr:MAG: hypothetical protein COU56_01770 [Candidatus Pacearchaeota archaeon CG10_big_fil_rev_8_21_14_0_10_31_9]
MDKRGIAKISCIFLLVVLFIGLVMGAIGNPGGGIESSYSLGEKIKGFVNISLESKNTNSKFEDSFGNSISLIDVLKKRSYNYSCNPANCESGYTTSGNEESQKTVPISGDKFIGLKLNGANLHVSSASLGFSSNAGSSCNSQLSLDVLDDGKINWENPKYTNDACGSELKSSCYNTFSEWASIDNNELYCEQINLPKAPAFELKTKLKYSGSSFNNGDIKAFIWDNGGFIAECNLTQPTSSGSDVSCNAAYSNKDAGNSYVCIKKESSAASGYQLNYRTTGSFCGAPGVPSSSTQHVADYNIIASAKKYDTLGSFNLDEQNYSKQNDGDSLTQGLDIYITENYNRDCSSGCVIPIKLSGVSQDLTVNNINLEYTSDGAPGGASKNTIFEVSKSPATVSSGFLKIDLSDLSFRVPNQQGEKTFTLNLDGVKIIESKINITGERKLQILQIYPRIIAVAQPTTFMVFTESDANNTNIEYKWNFGDNTEDKTSTSNKVSHTYSSLGNYSVSVKAIEKGQEIDSKTFIVDAISPKEAINETIADYKKRLELLTNQANNLSALYQPALRELIDLQEVNSELSSIETEYRQLIARGDTSDSEYVTLMKTLADFNMPISIQNRQVTIIPFINNPENIELQEIKDLFFDEDYIEGYDEEYKSALLSWDFNNIDVTIEHKILSVYFTNSVEDIISEFKIKIDPKSSLGYDGYLVIKEDSSNLVFNENYDKEEKFGLTGIKVSLDNSQNIVFAVKGGVDVFELPMYISPPLKELSIDTSTDVSEPKGFGWGKFIFGMFMLLIITLVIYIFLQEWYKHNYEVHLFKNKHDLYNLMNFIQNARRQGLSDDDIKKKLKGTKWSGEQITYAMNRLDGKRVGMWEIPIFKFWQKRKMEREIIKNAQPRRVI